MKEAKEVFDMKVNISAGHNPDNKVACGAIGLIKESTEARKIKDLVIKYLKSAKCTVYDCTVNNGTSQNDVLRKIVTKCNAHDVDLDVSIHFNSGRADKKGDGKIGGCEVLVYSEKSKSYDEAKRICAKLKAIGFKNRGVKVNNGLYVLKNTKAPALLVEVCFVDDEDDIELYQKNVNKIAKAIAEGIIGKKIANEAFKPYKVKITADALNVRKGASTKHGIIEVIYKNELHIVNKVSNGWGQIKTSRGNGWINLKYTTKI